MLKYSCCMAVTTLLSAHLITRNYPICLLNFMKCKDDYTKFITKLALTGYCHWQISWFISALWDVLEVPI